METEGHPRSPMCLVVMHNRVLCTQHLSPQKKAPDLPVLPTHRVAGPRYGSIRMFFKAKKPFGFNRLPFGMSNAPINRDDHENQDWIRWSRNNSKAERPNSLDRYQEHQGNNEGQNGADRA